MSANSWRLGGPRLCKSGHLCNKFNVCSRGEQRKQQREREKGEKEDRKGREEELDKTRQTGLGWDGRNKNPIKYYTTLSPFRSQPASCVSSSSLNTATECPVLACLSGHSGLRIFTFEEYTDQFITHTHTQCNTKQADLYTLLNCGVTLVLMVRHEEFSNTHPELPSRVVVVSVPSRCGHMHFRSERWPAGRGYEFDVNIDALTPSTSSSST